MRAMQGVKVSSTMTKSNPRPRKYASASDRQAAYRARAPEVCLRAESKTVDTLDKIAGDLDISRADLLLSMTKFALANHDWARFGLTHKPLPFEYGIEKENIAMNPLPIWARPRPKNLGKSIPLTAAQKRKAKALAAAAGRKYPNLVDNIAASRNPTMKKPSPAQIAARKKFAEMARSGALNRKRQIASKANPAKKTVSQKISQLVHEGYPQKQSIAIALSEQRKGKVKSNPITETLIYGLPKGENRDYMEELMYAGGLLLTKAEIQQVLDAASAAGYHSFRITGFDPTMKPDFSKVLQTKKRKRNPMIISAQADKNLSKQGSRGYIRKLLDQYSDMGHVVSIKQARTGSIAIALDGGRYINVEAAKGKLEKFFGITDKTGQKNNPASGRKGSQVQLNPMAAAVKSSSYSNFKYCVEAKRSLGAAGSVFETVAMFATKAQAQDYAKAILKSHPSVTLRIKTYK